MNATGMREHCLSLQGSFKADYQTIVDLGETVAWLLLAADPGTGPQVYGERKAVLRATIDKCSVLRMVGILLQDYITIFIDSVGDIRVPRLSSSLKKWEDHVDEFRSHLIDLRADIVELTDTHQYVMPTVRMDKLRGDFLYRVKRFTPGY